MDHRTLRLVFVQKIETVSQPKLQFHSLSFSKSCCGNNKNATDGFHNACSRKGYLWINIQPTRGTNCVLLECLIVWR